jgi:hypothetical protein
VGDAGEASASQDKRRFGFVETHELDEPGKNKKIKKWNSFDL